MKTKIIIFVLFSISLFGCGGGKYLKLNYAQGVEMSATTGNTMFSRIYGASNMFDANLLDRGYKEEFIYSGKIGNIIKIDYQEYYFENSRWYARDKFFKHLEYDISTNTNISYQDFKIKIISADGNEVKFIVL